ncbi:MAG TPA: PAS domain S-box protein [Polyangiales bacterium]|nr:PAS domain S-box protein [Polyangiales bacterium]
MSIDLGPLFRSAPHAYLVVSPELRVLGANACYLNKLRTNRDDLVGQPFVDLIPRLLHDPTGDVASELRASLQRVLRSQQSDRLDVRRYELPGAGASDRQPFRLCNTPLLDENGSLTGILHSLEDCGDYEKGNLEHRYAEVLDSAPDAIVVVASDGRIELVNEQTVKLFGYARGELLGEKLERLMPERMRERHALHVQRFFTQPAPRPMASGLELLAARKDGSEFPIEVSLNPLHSERGISVSAAIRDISERKRAEAEARLEAERHSAELRLARIEAEAASSAKSEFLSSMSHELRTPMNSILGFTQLLMRDVRDPLSARHRERLGHIQQSGEHLLRLIDEILDLARIESGRVPVSLEPVGLHEVLGEVVRTLAPLANEHDLQLEAAPVAAEVPLVVADRVRLLQILMNFGSNAIKYNRPRGRVTFTARLREDRVRLQVEDTGMGIAAEQQSKLFQAFQRAGQESGPIQGTGIGLTITKKLAELMDGCVGFESTLNVGSVFWVELPLAAANTRSLARDTRPPSSAPLVLPSRGLVLYVEDNPTNIAFMCDLFEDLEGLELVTARSAAEGLLLTRARRPQVILMDINLPDMSGSQALHVLQSAPETAAIPVIAVTAAATERERKAGLQLGFFRYLTKPIDVDELMKALDSALQARRLATKLVAP